jgi:O-glycosyl hydrolase
VILINTSSVGQVMDGFGASLTDGSAQLFATLKAKDNVTYDSVLDFLFNQRTGINILRVPIGTTDFSPESLQYTMADKEGIQANVNDTQGPLSYFSMTGANTYIIPFLKDAVARNSNLKISLLPWSPPAWMKTNDNVNGGQLKTGGTSVLAEYLVKTVQGFKDALGVTPWALSVQNEPSNPTAYPSMSMSNDFELPVLALLRGRLAELGLGSVQLFGHEDNYNVYSDAAALMTYNQSSLDGIAWHCYNGSSSLISNYNSLVANVTDINSKTTHMTECSGEDAATGSSVSYSLHWWMNNIFNQPGQGVSSITTWNLALDSDNGPRLKRAYCTNCAGSIEIDTTKVTSNIQSILLAHHATAASDLTRFGGSTPSRVASSVSGDSNSCIASTLAFKADWNTSNTQRIGLVLQNTCQGENLDVVISLNGAQSFTVNVGSGITTVTLTTSS